MVIDLVEKLKKKRKSTPPSPPCPGGEEKEEAKKQVLIAVVGSTGSGKTELSIQIAKEIDGEIINADSKQLYKGLRVTTGHITDEEMQNMPHHLFGYVSPENAYSVEAHKNDALKKIEEIQKRKNIPILVGGTGLFIDVLTKNFKIPKNSRDKKITSELEKKTSDDLWEELLKVDTAYAKITHKNNRRRVIRALEVYYSSGQKISQKEKGEEKFDVLILAPKIEDREKLYERIDKRAKEIWHSGLLDEARVLFEMNLDESLPALTSIGIPEAFSFFRNEINKNDAIKKMQQKSRNYAKRQMTWWRGDDRVIELLP